MPIHEYKVELKATDVLFDARVYLEQIKVSFRTADEKSFIATTKRNVTGQLEVSVEVDGLPTIEYDVKVTNTQNSKDVYKKDKQVIPANNKSRLPQESVNPN
jgi:hypothetical protein